LAEAQPIARCACGTELPPERLSCPLCHRLVHAESLKQQIAEAARLEAAQDVRGALALLRSALELLPAGSSQHAAVSARAGALSDRIDSGLAASAPAGTSTGPTALRANAAERTRTLWKVGSAIGALALLGWKLKFALVFLATKGKLLLLGLGKTSTLFSMVLSLGVYWSLWGVWFALGLVLSIYVHEMGHVSALRHFGIRASAPMFVPGLGAFVRMKQYPQTPREDARIGLAGPIWGLGASLAALLAYAAFRYPLLAAVASVGAWINLFNLLPFWTLDGGRGFRALSRAQRIAAAAVVAAVWAVSQEGLLVLLGIAAAAQVFAKGAPPPGDRRALLTWAGLVVALSAVAALPVPT
jgi:Zn-dependent protease